MLPPVTTLLYKSLISKNERETKGVWNTKYTSQTKEAS